MSSIDEIFNQPTDKEVAELITKHIDEIRLLLSSYHEVSRLIIKSKVCQLIFSNHIDRAILSDYLLGLIEYTKDKDKETYLKRICDKNE